MKEGFLNNLQDLHNDFLLTERPNAYVSGGQQYVERY